MAHSRSKYEYPEKDVLQERIAKSGLTATAEELGIPVSTLSSHCKRHGIDSSRQDIRELKFSGKEISREEMLEDEIEELKKAARAKRKTAVRDERIIQAFKEATQKVTPKYDPPDPDENPGSSGDYEHILLLSDLHANEKVSREETLGLNAYDWEIMLERLAAVQRGVLSFQEHRPFPIKKLNIWMLGDMLSGTIHDELVETNEMGHEEAVVQLGNDLSVWVEEFVPHYESGIEVVGVVGNHPRAKKKPQAKVATDNSDWTMYKFIEMYHRNNPHISTYFPNAHFADVVVAERWRAFLMHGDGIRTTMVGVPWGGIVRQMQRLEAQFQQAGKPIDFFACGHWHQANDVRGISSRLYMNGSIKGIDEYGLKKHGAGDPPQQLLLTVNPKRGITDVSYIDCEEKYPNSEAVQRRSERS